MAVYYEYQVKCNGHCWGIPATPGDAADGELTSVMNEDTAISVARFAQHETQLDTTIEQRRVLDGVPQRWETYGS